jgi:hypothetical protein
LPKGQRIIYKDNEGFKSIIPLSDYISGIASVPGIIGNDDGVGCINIKHLGKEQLERSGVEYYFK